MKDIRLNRLTLENFKGQRRFVLDSGGADCSIYGDNATGKSTLYDALTWLLFGKDSRGQSNFEVKPLGPDGQVLDHGAVTSVEAELVADGEGLSLRKTYFEKWSTKRGSATESYDGNTSEYYADGVPVKKYEFERRVADLVDEGLFRTLTDVTWFCSGMDWRERRKVLFEVCGVTSDAEIMSGAEQFAPLSLAMGKLSMDDYKKKLQAQRSGLNGARNTIPARLDELKKTEDDLAQVDFAALHRQRDDMAAHLEQLRSELLKLGHGMLLDGKRNDLAAAKNELEACRNENQRHRAGQVVQVVDERPSLQRELDRQTHHLLRLTQLTRNELDVIQVQEGRVEECRAQWAKEDAVKFQPGNCPTCGQTMPPAALEEAKTRFEAEKERRKAGAVNASKVHKQAVQEAKIRREQYIQDAVATENEIARLKDLIAGYTPQEQPEIEDMPGFAQRFALLEARANALAAEVDKLVGESRAIRQEIQGKIDVLSRELDALNQALSQEGILAYTRERMEQLRQEAGQSAQELESLDQMLFLCDEFMRYKVRFIDESINARFSVVRWRLFAEQVNGGLADCCEATVDGVPYASLNSGARINAGLDVIATLSRHYGVSVPLVVDNAESVTQLLPGAGQVIRLIVSEKDKELRCEYGA